MNTGGWIFFISACSMIIGLTIYCFYKVVMFDKKTDN